MSIIKIGDCKGDDCGRTGVPIVNAKRGLCDTCNKKRLGTDVKEPYVFKHKVINTGGSHGNKRYRIKHTSEKGLINIKKDEEFYEQLWNTKPHYCEECDVFLGDDFRDLDGKVINRFRYSHILPKGGQYGIFRHRLINGNLLCLKCHEKWEHGDQKQMKIWVQNKVAIGIMINELIEINGSCRKK